MSAYDVKNLRKAALVILTVLFCAIFVYICTRERMECMGVAILSDTSEYTSYEYRDFSGSITHYGKPAAIDTSTSTIYISQNLEKSCDYVDFEGILRLNDNSCSMFFAPDDAFSDMKNAVKDGHPFRLIISDGSGKYMEYSVIFTSLPVISIEGGLSHLRDNDVEGDPPVEIFAGSINVWTPFDPEVKAYTAKSSLLEWHVRGHSAAVHDKKPWKVSLKDEKGENADLNLFGLGADDDWIINAIAYDHTRIREKLFIGLWNEMAEKTSHNTKMTEGQYAEVVMNGEYHGLYLVQRRIDTKLLGLTEHDILLKGARSYNPKYVYKAYEIIHTNLEHDYVYLLLENYYNRTDMSTFSVENFIDCNLFIQFAYARDNRLYNNTYFTMKAGPAGYNTVMTMWDTDISFGKKSVNGYNYEETIHTPMEREDTDSIRALHPDYDRRAYDRWQMLRQDVLSEENIAQHIENCMAEITSSSSLARDYKKWGIGEDSADTLEGVENFIAARLPWLDGYLAQQAESAIL